MAASSSHSLKRRHAQTVSTRPPPPSESKEEAKSAILDELLAEFLASEVEPPQPSAKQSRVEYRREEEKKEKKEEKKKKQYYCNNDPFEPDCSEVIGGFYNTPPRWRAARGLKTLFDDEQVCQKACEENAEREFAMPVAVRERIIEEYLPDEPFLKLAMQDLVVRTNHADRLKELTLVHFYEEKNIRFLLELLDAGPLIALATGLTSQNSWPNWLRQLGTIFWKNFLPTIFDQRFKILIF